MTEREKQVIKWVNNLNSEILTLVKRHYNFDNIEADTTNSEILQEAQFLSEHLEDFQGVKVSASEIAKIFEDYRSERQYAREFARKGGRTITKKKSEAARKNIKVARSSICPNKQREAVIRSNKARALKNKLKKEQERKNNG